MATNMFKKYTEAKTREWPVPEGTQAGDVVIHPVSDQVGVALTARGDSTTAAGIPGVTGGTIPNGGAGNAPDSATVAVDGSWLLEVAGASDSTPQGTTVYRVDADGTYSTTSAGGTAIGVTDDGAIVNGIAPVLIGAVL